MKDKKYSYEDLVAMLHLAGYPSTQGTRYICTPEWAMTGRCAQCNQLIEETLGLKYGRDY
jgi:virulence-associated protein VapD